MANIIDFGHSNSKTDYVETRAGCRIERLVALVHATVRGIGIIVGPPGVGKTSALSHCARTTRGVRYMVANPSAGASTDALGLACDALGVWTPSTRARRYDALCRQIAESMQGVTLLVDEAQHLNDQAIDQLRCVHDESGLALVFAGNATLQTRFNNTHVASFAQFTSRVGARLELDFPSVADAAALCGAWGITGDAEVDWLKQCVDRRGDLRIIDQLVPVAARLIGGPGAFRIEHLKDAARMLGLGKVLRL